MTWTAHAVAPKCDVCKTELKPLWQSLYCPNESRHAGVTVVEHCDKCASTDLYLFQATLLQCAACRACGRLMQGKVPKK